MERLHEITCPNCGTVWLPHLGEVQANGRVAPGVRCPVCYFEMHTRIVSEPAPLSIEDLEARLNALVDQAQHSGLSVEQIVQTLGTELAYMAEYAHPSHHFFVEVIDLGEHYEHSQPQPFPDRVAQLRERYTAHERYRELGAPRLEPTD